MNPFSTPNADHKMQAEWRVETEPVPYPLATTVMENRVDAITQNIAPEFFWLLEHPPLYTRGTSAEDHELKDPSQFPIYETGRGGRFTYHGPGQRVIYALCDLRNRNRDVREHVARLEEWIILTLRDFDVTGERKNGRIGIWVTKNGQEKKIAAIGVRVRHWVTYHGLALNVAPNLQHFKGIVPCGLDQYGVTSLQELGVTTHLEMIDAAFKKHHAALF